MEDFNRLVELYKKMSYKDKQNALINEFKTTLACIEKLNQDVGNKHDLLINKEITDINKSDATNDDYLEAYFVYLNMINDSLSSLLEKIYNEFYEELEKK